VIQAFLAKYILVVVLALAAATIGTGYGWYKTIQRLAVANSQIAQAEAATQRAIAARKAADRVTASLARKNAALALQNAAQGASLATALAESPSWADTPVPQGVQDALKR
jgi:hypothetical protein